VAVAAKRRVVINAGRRRAHKKRNRRMTPKQIKFFGSKAQKAALKRSNHRRRTAAVSRPNRSKKRRAGNRPRHARRNPGDILSLVLNPGGKKMAASKRRRSRRRSRASNPRRHRRRAASHRSNPARRHHSYGHRRRRTNRRHRRHNPGGGMSVKQGMMFAVGAGVGFFGSKLLTQAVMGTSNTGATGYLGNAVATAGLAVTAHMMRGVLGKNAGLAVLSGGILQLIARILTDQTPFGAFTSQLGVGDYQAQAFVTPQRLVHPLDSAQIEIPPGWGAPPIAIKSAGAPPAMLGAGAYNTQGFGASMYSPQGIYS
jgi:hypothetical protein